MKVHNVSMFTPTYCNFHIMQSESSSLLIPLAIYTVSVLLNHSQVFAGGLISWCAACDIRALSSSSYSNSALGPLIGPSHSTVSLCPLTPGSRSRLTRCPHRALSYPSQSVSDDDRNVTWGSWAPFDAWAARSGFRLTAAQRAQQQPEVEDHTGPARRHLHPESRPTAVGEGSLQHCWLVAGGGQHNFTPCHFKCLGTCQKVLGWRVRVSFRVRVEKVNIIFHFFFPFLTLLD